MGGMAKAAGRKLGGAIAARNPHLAKGAQLGGALDDIVQAGRAASKRAAGSKVQNQKPQNSQNQIAVMAQNIVAFAKKQPNGLQTVTAILRQLAQQNKQLAIAIHQSLKDTMAAKAGV